MSIFPFFKKILFSSAALQFSFISDVVAALKYLHHSSVGVHGNLRSVNCLVDSRYVVRLSGFGPKCLFGNNESDPPNPRSETGRDFEMFNCYCYCWASHDLYIIRWCRTHHTDGTNNQEKPFYIRVATFLYVGKRILQRLWKRKSENARR